MPKAYHRGADVRFHIALNPSDRALLDAIQAKYEDRIGNPLSLSIVVSLMLRELTKTRA